MSKCNREISRIIQLFKNAKFKLSKCQRDGSKICELTLRAKVQLGYQRRGRQEACELQCRDDKNCGFIPDQSNFNDIYVHTSCGYFDNHLNHMAGGISAS